MPARQCPQLLLLLLLLLRSTPALHHPHYDVSGNESTVESSNETSTDLSTETSGALSVTSESSTFTSDPASTTTSTTTTSTTATTIPVPPLSDIDLFKRTDTVLTSITASLDDLQKAVTVRTSEQELGPRPSASNPQPREQSDSFCTRPDDLCIKLYKNLNHIQYLMDVLVKSSETWDESRLWELWVSSEELVSLTKDIEESTDFTDSVDTTAYLEFLSTTGDAVSQGQKTARGVVRSIQKRETDSIVFVSVIGAVGGIMMVVSLVGVALVCYSYKQATDAAPGHHPQADGWTPGAAASSTSRRGDHHPRPATFHHPSNRRSYSPPEFMNDPYIRCSSSANNHFDKSATNRPIISRQLGGSVGGLHRTSY